ncbi:MAG: HAMP domain-containing histidine kinase, partial [Verrucomicrobiae bacterium]|nr:HAMP domain-containing histidine kinase [Verrucomicrobiae bacterium]
MDAGKPPPAKTTTPADELKEFVYRVSHDLRSPISTIIGYAELLAADHADKLDDEGRRYLNAVRAAAQQLNAMLEDLVLYSRVGRAPDAPGLGDLGALIERARQWALERVGPKDADWKLPSEWPRVYGVQSELQMLFGLLLINALQHNPKPKPRVEVTWHEEPGRIVCAVRDDGPGIDRQH